MNICHSYRYCDVDRLYEMCEINGSFRPNKIKIVLESIGVGMCLVKGNRYYKGISKKDTSDE